MSIPKIIHQIWIGPKPAPTNLMNTWKEKHPDFEYIFWTEQEIQKRNLQLTCIEKINMISEINGKADIIRWEILYNYGGYFVDADSICIEPFDDVFSDKTAFASFENENIRAGLIATGTMGFVPKHRLCYDIIEWIKSNESTQAILETRAWYSVGPGILTRMLDTGKYKDFTIFPSYYFLPIHFLDFKYNGHKKVYAYQEWGTAKQSYDTMNNIVLPIELVESNITNWVSVLITSYNTHHEYMKECLDSIKSQNGFFGIEVVWINDGSSLENSEILEDLLHKFKQTSRFTRVIYKKNDENIGTAKSSNIGLDLCSCDLIFKMDSDDIMLPDRMKIQIDFMDKNPNAVICGTNIQLFISENDSFSGKIVKKVVRETVHDNIITWDDLYHSRYSWYMNNPTLCYRKAAIDKIGKYRTNDSRILYIHEDYDLLARILKTYKFAYNLPEVLLLYRLHPNQLTHKLNIHSEENIKLRNDIIENAFAAQIIE
jgi:mannosyltransferase OCH1-like enzyme